MGTVQSVTGTYPLTIQEVSRRSGLSESTLRYYEKIGLITGVDRDDSSGHRRYDEATVEAIEALACLRETGMSVQDMRAYLRHLSAGTGKAGEMRDLFTRNAERAAADLERMRARLTYLRLKADLWDARARHDKAAESDAIAALGPATIALR